MERYDYILCTRRDRYGDESSSFVVFDRQSSCTDELAICNDRFNAELVVRALNDARTK